MIISKTPFRVSFVGGGSDLKSYYSKSPGAVVSTAINKYMYITVNRRFDETIRIGYSKTEIVKDVNRIQHPLVREAMKLTGLTKRLEITSIADIHSRGTGLGSSSSFTVGLLNALYACKGKYKSAETLAREACKIEIDIVKSPIGKQDQYIAAYGGLKFIQFNPDESVFVSPVICSKKTKKELEDNLLMFYTGLDRDSGTILAEQKRNTEKRFDVLTKMKSLAMEMKDSLNNNDLNTFGHILHKNWEYKKQLSRKITNLIIDRYYKKAIKAGAIGGKISGGGGGGFLLFYCEKKKQNKLRYVLKNLTELPFAFEPQGSRIAYIVE